MENKEEDEVRKRWEQEARDKARLQQEDVIGARPRKRLREIEFTAGGASAAEFRMIEGGMLTPDELDTTSEASSSRGRSTGRGRGKKGGVGRATRAKSKITEIREDDEDYIEVD